MPLATPSGKPEETPGEWVAVMENGGRHRDGDRLNGALVARQLCRGQVDYSTGEMRT